MCSLGFDSAYVLGTKEEKKGELGSTKEKVEEAEDIKGVHGGAGI